MFLFNLYADDECFYVGLGHEGRSAKRSNNYAPDNYKPFQCCPTKLEKSTKVPKMTAQRIGHSAASDGGKRQTGNFQFGSADSTPTPTPSYASASASQPHTKGSSAAKTQKQPKSQQKSSPKSPRKPVASDSDEDHDNNDDDDNDDDDSAEALVKVSYAKHKSNPKPATKPEKFPPIKTAQKPSANSKKTFAKNEDKLNVKTGTFQFGKYLVW